jgi:hypothetical protein
MTINIDFGSERTIRCKCIKWLEIKSHKIRSVAFRSRHVMIIVDKLLIYQLESNSLCSILHISETKPTRNGRWAPWSSVVWLFEIPRCDGENVITTFSDRVTLYVHSGTDQSHLAPNHERHSCLSAPTRSIGYYIKWFCTRISILIYNS